MKFLMDAQLPLRLARQLRSGGHDVLHACDLPSGVSTTDTEMAMIADNDRRILMTKDADFVDQHQLRGIPERLLLISVGNVRNEELLQLFQDHDAQLMAALNAARFVELNWLGVTTRD